METPGGVQRVAIRGHYVVTLRRETAGRYSLAGSWTQPLVGGTLGGVGGGPVAWGVDLGRGPVTATGRASGSAMFTVHTVGPVMVAVTGTHRLTFAIAR